LEDVRPKLALTERETSRLTGEVIEATVEPEPAGPSFEQLIAAATTREECIGIWEAAKMANAPGKLETLIVQRMQEIRAGHIVVETAGEHAAGDVVDAEVIGDQPAPKGRSGAA
jgi:hypothetical protein